MSLKEKMTALADAVREKAELTGNLTIDEMTAAVSSLVVNGVEVDARALTVTPSKSTQNFTASALGENVYYGTVTVDPIPSEYITTTDATAASGDIIEGKTAYVNGVKITGTAAIPELGTTSAEAYHLLEGYSAYSYSGKIQGTMKNLGIHSVTLTPNKITAYSGAGYTEGFRVDVAARSTMTFAPSYKEQMYNGKAEGEFLESVFILPVPAACVMTEDATAAAGDIAAGKTAYVKGEKITGTATGGGGGDLYRCTAVYGPQIHKYISVSNANSEDCNGIYSDTGLTKTERPIYSYKSSSGTTWYIYFISSEMEGDSWFLSDNLNVTMWWDAHYYGGSLNGTWYAGEIVGEGSASVSEQYSVQGQTERKTWDGFKLLQAEGGYVLADEITTGLLYGVGETSDYVNDSIMPEIGGIYNSDCTIEVSQFEKPDNRPLTFTAEEAWSTVALVDPYPGNTDMSGIMYSTDGKTWNKYTSGATIILSHVGDYVQFKNTQSVFTYGGGTSASFSLSGKIAASGELKSMLNYAESCPDYCLKQLFRGQGALTAIPEISCNTLGHLALDYIFNGCSNVKKARVRLNHILPSEGSMTAINGMFAGCSSLNLIEVDFTSWEGFDTNLGWVSGVATKGVFIKPAELPEEYGEKYIPEGWTVVNK